MVAKPGFESAASSFADAASSVEAGLFQDILRKQGRMPAGVRRVEFRFGEDSTGASAVWVVFVVKDELKPSAESIEAIRAVAEQIRSEIRRSGTERWPYVSIEAE